MSSLQTLREEVEREQLQLELAQLRAHQQLLAGQQQLYEGFVDPREAWLDEDGLPWQPLGGGSAAPLGRAPQTEQELRAVRDACRQLAVKNEFALSAHENRISYLVGPGHRYTVTPRDEADRGWTATAQALLDRFVRAANWGGRQQEIVRRMDRDGECFLRFFAVPPEEGLLAVRFVEPEQVAAPQSARENPAAGWGVLTRPEDAEHVLGYYVDGTLVPAAEMQHRKANVDRNARRGLPTFYPVLGNLQRIEKLMRNMSVLAQTQAAIAVIRKHQQGTATSVQAFADAQASYTTAGSSGTRRHKRLLPGTILDAPSGIDYQFPSIGVDASKLVSILQAELRAVASRLVMPEFMLSADASNANYASTLVAEGPAVKMFQRLQASLMAEDLLVMRRVLDRGIEAGLLPGDAQERVLVQTEAPSLVIRDKLAEARANDLKLRHGVLSRRTWQLQEGLDPEQERRNREEEE